VSGDRPEGTEQILGDPRRLEDALRGIRNGLTDMSRDVTLTLSAATTTVTHYGVSTKSWVGLMPLDSTTAAEYGLGTTWVVPAKGSFVINHPNNGTTRKYRYLVMTGRQQ